MRIQLSGIKHRVPRVWYIATTHRRTLSRVQKPHRTARSKEAMSPVTLQAASRSLACCMNLAMAFQLVLSEWSPGQYAIVFCFCPRAWLLGSGCSQLSRIQVSCSLDGKFSVLGNHNLCHLQAAPSTQWNWGADTLHLMVGSALETP